MMEKLLVTYIPVEKSPQKSQSKTNFFVTLSEYMKTILYIPEHLLEVTSLDYGRLLKV